MKNKKIISKIITIVISLILGMIIILKENINYNKGYPIEFINNFHFYLEIFLKSIIIGLICYILIILLFKLLDKIKLKNYKKEYSNKIICIISFLGIFITNLIFLITYYPGSNMNDTLFIISGPISSSGQHPIIYNLWLSCTYNIFYKLFNNMNLAYFLTSIVQVIIMTSIITLIIRWFNKKFKNKTATIILLIYYIFIPIVSNYNIVLIKDSLFSIVLLLHIPLLYELIKTKGEILKNKKYLVFMFIIFLSTILVRNNGLYIILFLSFVLLIIYKNYIKYLLPIVLTAIIISFIPNLVISKQENLFQEKVGIPIQQLSYIIKHDSKNIKKENKTYLNKIMNLTDIKENYNPYSVDTIKWHKKFNREYLDKTKIKFIKTWFTILPTHFESYIKSYLLTTYELWSFEKFNPIQSRFLGIDKSDYYNQEEFKNLENKTIFPKKIQQSLEKYYEKTTIFFGNGTCFWILIVTMLYTIYKNKTKYLILSLPLIGLWLTLMISSPISYALRYMSPYIYMLPFIIAITFITKDKCS